MADFSCAVPERLFVRVAFLEFKAVQLGIVHQNCFSVRRPVPKLS